MSDTVGYIENPVSEAHVPISNWRLLFVADEPFFWGVQLDPGGEVYKLPKGMATTPVPPEPAPEVNTLVVFSIPNDLAVQLGLPIPDDAPIGPKRLARMQAPPGPATEPDGPA